MRNIFRFWVTFGVLALAVIYGVDITDAAGRFIHDHIAQARFSAWTN